MYVDLEFHLKWFVVVVVVVVVVVGASNFVHCSTPVAICDLAVRNTKGFTVDNSTWEEEEVDGFDSGGLRISSECVCVCDCVCLSVYLVSMSMCLSKSIYLCLSVCVRASCVHA